MWIVTERAVREYAALCERAPDERARAELYALCVTRIRHVRQQENGLSLWRGPRPLRLRLLVQSEGAAHRVVSVLPDCASRTGPYRSSKGGRGSKRRRTLRQQGLPVRPVRP